METYTKLKNNRVALSEAIPLPMPFTLFVDPTNHCNFHCSFCPRNQSDFHQYAGDFTHMTRECFDKIIKGLQQFHGKLKVWRLWYLGEPLLGKNFFYILEQSIRYNIAERIELSTNGSMLTRDTSEKILSLVKSFAGSFYLRVSVYSVWEKRERDITKSSITVGQIFDNVKTFRELRDRDAVSGGGTNVRIYAKKLDTYDSENEEFLHKYRPIVDEVELEEPMEWNGAGNRELLDEAYSKDDIARLKQNKMPKACAYPFHTLAIQADGKVVCCCVDWTRGTCVGDVNEESLYDIWHGEKLRQLRYLHLSGRRSEIPACCNCHKLPHGGVYEKDNLDDVNPEILSK